MKYKIKIYKHSGIKAEIEDDIVKMEEYFESKSLPLDVIIETTDVPKHEVQQKLFFQNDDGKNDVVMYLYNRGDFQANSFGLAFNVSKSLRGVYLATSVVDDNVDYTWKSMVHEIVHTLFYKLKAQNVLINDPLDRMLVNGVWKPYYKNEELDAPDGNFAQAWRNLSPYMSILIGKPQYKYFSQKEVDKYQLKPELWQMLDKARGMAEIPFIITSGRRSVVQNAFVRGVSKSSHTLGTGVDIRANSSTEKFKIVTSALKTGFNRIGCYQKHIHLDLGKNPDFPENVLWISGRD